MKNLILMLIFTLLFIAPNQVAYSQSINGCSPVSSDAKCGQCDTDIITSVDSLLSKSESGNISSIDSFLEQLPESMKKDFVMMSDSRSFQRSDALNPRVLMKSPNSDVIITFNSHPSVNGTEYPGSNKLEMMVWNGAEAKFDFIDVEFPSEEAGAARGQIPKVTKNPQLCLNCHGGEEARPNWDPYNFWAGQIPFNRDTIIKGTKESEDYLELLKRIEGTGTQNNTRLEKLMPTLSASDLTAALEYSSSFQLRTQSNNSSDGPGVSMFDELTPKNQCRIAHSLKELPFINDLKYALAAVQKNCINIDQFVPEKVKTMSNKYFEDRGFATNEEGKFEYDLLVDQTRDLQQGVFSDKRDRQFWVIEKEIRMRNPEIDSFKAAQTEFQALQNGRSIENREVAGNADPMAGFRYLLEPLGVRVDNWSMSIDPGTYSFADLFSSLYQFGIFDEISDEGLTSKSCNELKELSLDNYVYENVEIQLQEACERNFEFKPLSSNQEVIDDLSDAALTLLRDRFGEVVNQNGCVACHIYANKQVGAPNLPFNNPVEFENLVNQSILDENGGLATSIWSRVNKPEGSIGHMPLMGPPLPSEDLDTIRQYINMLKLRKQQP